MRRHLNPLHNPYPSSSSNHYITTQDSRLLHWRTSSTTTTTTTTGGLDDRNFKIHGQTLLYIFILFSIILLATLLLLYARWLFRLRYLSHSPPPSSNPSPHQLLLHLSRPVSTTTRLHHHHQLGLDQSTINLIPIVLYQRSSSTVDESGNCGEKRNNDVQECCICLGVFEDGDKVKILPRCHHNYHSECVDVWLCSHSSCPLCRLPVAVRVDLDPNYYPPV